MDDVCQEIVESAENAFGIAVVDLSTGLMLGGYYENDFFTEGLVDTVAAASVDMFRGRNVLQIEKNLTEMSGVEVINSIEEIQLTTASTYHFLSIIPTKPDYIAVLITGREISLGMGWAALRNTLKALALVCP